MMPALFRLMKQLGYTFQNEALLKSALTHRSVLGDNNERLEFLGDSLLNCMIGEALFERFPKANEGELTRLRASLVRGECLAVMAKELNLGSYLRVGGGEQKSGGHQRDSIVADALEAIFGAIYLDSDFNGCRQTIRHLYASRLSGLHEDAAPKDAKTRLQEYLQGRNLELPIYQVIRVEGEPHEQHFFVSLEIRTLKISIEGKGSSRRKAEQDAAELALKKLST